MVALSNTMEYATSDGMHHIGYSPGVTRALPDLERRMKTQYWAESS